MERKDFIKKGFSLLAGSLLDLAQDITGVIDPLESFAKTKQRPPGALANEKAFLEKCTGCDKCMAACPYNVITIDDLEKRDPFIEQEVQPCRWCEDTPCIKACDSGALRLFHPEASSKESREHPEWSGCS